MNIKLLGERVLVDLERAETKTASGLIVSKETSPSDMQYGKVVSVGTGKKTDQGIVPVDLKEGERVMFQYGTLVLLEGKSYYLVNEADVILVL
jgi:chaperonin GroES